MQAVALWNSSLIWWIKSWFVPLVQYEILGLIKLSTFNQALLGKWSWCYGEEGNHFLRRIWGKIWGSMGLADKSSEVTSWPMGEV